MPIDPITDVAKANDKFRAQLRSTWISSPADGSLLVTAVPENVPTIVVVGWNTDLETVFRVEGKSGSSASNYALTGVTRIKGANTNLPENTPVNILNNEEFFNQYEEKINLIIDEVNDSLLVVDDLENIVQGGWVDVPDAGTMDFDLADGANRKFRTEALGADATFTVSNVLEGMPFLIRVLQGATPRDITFFSTVKWIGTGTPDVSADVPANKVGVYMFIATGASTFDGYFLGVEP